MDVAPPPTLTLRASNGPDPDIVVITAAGDVTRVLGIPPDVVIGQSIRALFPGDETDRAVQELLELPDDGSEIVRELPTRGRIPATWLGYRARRHGDELVVTLTDLTADKLRDVWAAAAASQRELLFERSPIGIVIHGPDGRIVDVNPAFARLTGAAPQALLGRTVRDFIDAIPMSNDPERMPFRSGDGIVYAVDAWSAPLPHGYRQVLVRDRTALEESEERFRAAFDDAGSGMALVTRDGRNLRVNRALSRMLGYSEAELLSITWKDVVHPDDLDASLLNWERFDRHETVSLHSEKRYFHKDGHAIWVQVILSMVRDDAGNPRYFLAQVDDISERRRLQEALRDSEQRFRSAFEQSAVGMALLTPAGVTLRINQALADMLGYSFDEARSLQWRDIVHPDDQEGAGTSLARVALGAQASSRAERRYVRRDGSTFWVQATVSAVHDAEGRPEYLLAQIEDITERRRLADDRREMESRLSQAQKMEAVGRLAGGVAHDFNNLIAAISATSELLLEEMASDDPRRDDLQNIALACDRAKTLTRQLLSFARQDVERLQLVAVDDVVDAISPLLHRLMGPGHRLEITRSAGGVLVHVDPSQIELALINLVANARDAMPGGGTVGIATRTVEVATNDPQRPDVPAGRYVQVDVADAGTGIEPHVLPHLYEPFFTTKPHGKGTGLGLPTVRAFIDRLRGAITVRSVPGDTVFSLYLPVSASTMPVARVAAPRPRAPVGSARRILVVDDEPVVRRTIRRLLERRGFDVVDAADADAALLHLASDPEVEIVLSDHAMPGRTGRQLLADVQRLYPSMRRVLMSGFAADGEVREVVEGLEVPFLGKPFTIDELIAVLGE